MGREEEKATQFVVWLFYLEVKKLRVAVIGSGIVGALTAREFVKYNLDLEIFEKLPDVGWGVTKANSGILHAGYDDEPGTLRAKYCARGNTIYDQLSRELHFEMKRIGSLVVAFNDTEKKKLDELMEKGEKNGVKGLKLLSRIEALEIEPNLSREVIAALYAPSAGIMAPWEAAQAAVENAVENGAKLHLSTEVKTIISKSQGGYLLNTNRGEFEFDVVVNAAGLWADELAKSAGVNVTPLHPRRGEYILLDQRDVVRTIVFPAPSKAGKGILVLPTVHDTVLLGPTSEDLPSNEKENTLTTSAGMVKIIRSVKKLVPAVDISKSIRTFAGLRPENGIKDFVIKKERGMIHIVATRSPGLTSAPAIAQDIVEMALKGYNVEKNKNFNPVRNPIPKVANMDDREREALIASNPAYGRVVCRCNKVTEGEIVDAIKRGARTLDGIKFRTTAMFGRCQGSFCTVKIMEIMRRELGMDFDEMRKNLPNSAIVNGDVR